MSEQAPSKPNNKRKRSSPFRIKVGTVVALRMQATGNSISVVTPGSKSIPIPFHDYTFVWTDPYPGRDEGLGLLGKCVRCFLPQVIPNQKSRVLEGQVVGVHHSKPNKVHLLVEKKHADAFPFLRRVPEAVVNGDASKGARRRAQLEERIRGVDKVTIQLTLSKPGATNEEKNKVVQWAMLKLVPSRLFYETSNEQTVTHAGDGASRSNKKEPSKTPGSKLTVKHVGDGNDTGEQQISNWRWLACRYHDTFFRRARLDQPSSHGLPGSSLDKDSQPLPDMSTLSALLSAGFVGLVTKVDPVSPAENSLATVTLERLILPQQTASGRLEDLLVYQDYDSTNYALEVPIEQLVVIAKQLERQKTTHVATVFSEEPYMLDHMFCLHQYSLKQDAYNPIVINDAEDNTLDASHICHRCRLVKRQARTCSSESCAKLGRSSQQSWCSDCVKELNSNFAIGQLPCCQRQCDCDYCRIYDGPDGQNKLFEAVKSAWKNISAAASDHGASDLAVPMAITKLIETTDFALPRYMLDHTTHPKPLPQPSTRTRPILPKKPFNIYGKAGTKRPKKPKVTEKPTASRSMPSVAKDKDQDVLPNSLCSRLLDYDFARSLTRSRKQIQSFSTQGSTDRPRNIREALMEQKWGDIVEKEEKPNAKSRAARANQRRFMKDVSFLGAHGLSVDSLASREPQIRFDRSKIHAWGVFADEDIATDEMIIEYRGEIIGNAVAEKRERLYEQEKIGSDYMFRIDNLTVCDATKQGNVARFINASCEPNCYTKIITIDGCKRIVIYSKRAIAAGEELSYDYKFPLEYDPEKRILCHCGAKECRGFMNWDKKYVAVDSPSDTKEGVTLPEHDIDSTSSHSSDEDDTSTSAESAAHLSDHASNVEPEEPAQVEQHSTSYSNGNGKNLSPKFAGDPTKHHSVPSRGGQQVQNASLSIDGHFQPSHAPQTERKRPYQGAHDDHSDGRSWNGASIQSDLCKQVSHAPLRKRIKMVADAEHDMVDGPGR